MVYYLKSLRTGRVPPYQGGDPLPVGEWLPTISNPVLCQRGWHALRWEDVRHHVSDELWVVELSGVVVEGDDKVAAESMRLIRQVESWSRKAYNEAVAPARKAYDEAAATTGKAYNEALAPARKAYNEALATAGKAFNEAVAPAQAELAGLDPDDFAHLP
jgi:hypothetical protein